jgi:amino acid transporter
VVTVNQLIAGTMVIQYWVKPEMVNPGVFITIFLILVVSVNYFGVGVFGEFEFWLSSLKILVLVGLMLLSLILALGGGPDHEVKVSSI